LPYSEQRLTTSKYDTTYILVPTYISGLRKRRLNHS